MLYRDSHRRHLVVETRVGARCRRITLQDPVPFVVDAVAVQIVGAAAGREDLEIVSKIIQKSEQERGKLRGHINPIKTIYDAGLGHHQIVVGLPYKGATKRQNHAIRSHQSLEFDAVAVLVPRVVRPLVPFRPSNTLKGSIYKPPYDASSAEETQGACIPADPLVIEAGVPFDHTPVPAIQEQQGVVQNDRQPPRRSAKDARKLP